jgi:AraC-like DNA-binding protein
MALLKKGTSVSEAAENCGFQNLSYFSRTYKKYIGELPGKHKKT